MVPSLNRVNRVNDVAEPAAQGRTPRASGVSTLKAQTSQDAIHIRFGYAQRGKRLHPLRIKVDDYLRPFGRIDVDCVLAGNSTRNLANQLDTPRLRA